MIDKIGREISFLISKGQFAHQFTTEQLAKLVEGYGYSLSDYYRWLDEDLLSPEYCPEDCRFVEKW
jgi:hypothetical protein